MDKTFGEKNYENIHKNKFNKKNKNIQTIATKHHFINHYITHQLHLLRKNQLFLLKFS